MGVMRVIVRLLLMVALLSGCAHKFTPEQLDQVIVIGKTTKNEIVEYFGPPDKKEKTGGIKIISGKKEQIIHKSQEIWWYSPHQFKWLDVIEPEPLKIVFDDNGVVVQYDFEIDD